MRHRRRRELNSRERAAAVEAASRLHRHVRIDLANLQPSSPDYRVLLGLCEAVNRCIRELTGEDPEWMQVTCSRDVEPLPVETVSLEPRDDVSLLGALRQAARR